MSLKDKLSAYIFISIFLYPVTCYTSNPKPTRSNLSSYSSVDQRTSPTSLPDELCLEIDELIQEHLGSGHKIAMLQATLLKKERSNKRLKEFCDAISSPFAGLTSFYKNPKN